MWLAPFFFAGSLMALYAKRIPLNGYLGLAMLVLVPIGAELNLAPGISALPAAYLVLLLGVVLPLQRVGAVNDISYGMYIYAFPLQQLMNELGANRLPVGVSLTIAVAATVPFAAASWFFVEKPMLRWYRNRTRSLRPSTGRGQYDLIAGRMWMSVTSAVAGKATTVETTAAMSSGCRSSSGRYDEPLCA